MFVSGPRTNTMRLDSGSSLFVGVGDAQSPYVKMLLSRPAKGEMYGGDVFVATCV